MQVLENFIYLNTSCNVFAETYIEMSTKRTVLLGKTNGLKCASRSIFTLQIYNQSNSYTST